MKKQLYAISLNLQRISDRLDHFPGAQAACIRDLAGEVNQMVILMLQELEPWSPGISEKEK